jgi:hypothetical protein
MSVGSDIVNVPPYVGVPRLSHQFPVEVVVDVVVAVADAVDVGTVEVVVDIILVVVVVVGDMLVVVAVVVVVEEEQDANASDVTKSKLITIQTPLFI